MSRLPLLLLFFLLNNSAPAIAQTCTPIYHNTYHGSGNDEAFDVMVTTDGGSIVTGRTTTNSSLWDGFLMRLNEQGSIIWAKTFGGGQYDELVKVKQTQDGGFIAIGATRSFGLSAGETWVIKTDGNGNLSWSRTFNHNGQPTKPKRIIQLTDGGYAIAMNVSDNTAQGNGLIIRTDATGQPVWTKLFDNGNDDGINNIFQDGNYLLAGGYGTVNDREGVLMRMNLGDGSVVWAKKFARRGGRHDEIVEVETINGGLAFGASSIRLPTTSTDNNYLTLFKTRGDDEIFYQRRVETGTSGGNKNETPELRSTADSGFIYCINDTTAIGRGVIRKISHAGISDWGRALESFGTRQIRSFDFFRDKGYVIAGFYGDGLTGGRNRIVLMKTNNVGGTGSCSSPISAHFTDTTNYEINPFTWSSVTSVGLVTGNPAPVATPLNYTVTTRCGGTYCRAPDAPLFDGCYATLLTHLKTQGYSFTPFDVVSVADGYIIAGYNVLHWNVEPMLVKVRLDGTVAWSKSMTEYMHRQVFDQITVLSDGNLMITGVYSLEIFHQGFSGANIVKINPAGDVLWSKYIQGEIYDLKPGNDGEVVGTLIRNASTPPATVSVFKMDNDGNFTWQKRLNQHNEENHAMYRRIAYDGQYIYAAGHINNGTPQAVAVDKLDQDGNKVWSKVVMVNGLTTAVEGIELIGDSVYVLARVYEPGLTPYFAQKRLGTIKMGKDGEGMSAYLLNNHDLLYDLNYYWSAGAQFNIVTKTTDGNFVVADRTPSLTDSSVVLTKFSPGGTVLWSRRYSNLKNHFISSIRDDHGSLLILGRKSNPMVDQTNQFETLLMRTDHNGQVVPNGTDYCLSVPNTAYTIPANLLPRWNYNTHPANDTNRTTPHGMLTRHFDMNSTVSCGTAGNCSSVNISGPQAICSRTDTITYEINRNAGCTLPVLWKYDPALVQVTGVTDTTLKVLFRRSGTGSIIALLRSGCGLLTDTLAVTIPQSGELLSLGADTVICTGTSILLNARKGYLSYLWQDGSTDSTFTATQPGLYHVTVTDACNGIYRDTIEVLAHPPIPFDLGPDRVKCNNDTLRFSAPPGFMNYSWSPPYNISSTTQGSVVVNPQADTSYYIKAEKTPGCFAYDTIHVTVHRSPLISLGADTSICSGATLRLDGGAGFTSYLWNDVPGSRYTDVTAAGLYRVTGITAEGCASSDTLQVLNVWALPQVSLDKNPSLCEESTRTLDAGSFSSYLWHDGSTSSSYTITGTGQYHVLVTDNRGCKGSDTVKVHTILPSPRDFLPGDTSICSYGKITLQPVRSYSWYQWKDGSRNSSITIDKPGTYWLQVRDDKNCTGNDTVVVTPKDCMKGVYIPTAFTPNNDGRNELFRAMVFGVVKKFELTVYNRWGQVVFRTADAGKGWDGKVAGISQRADVFVWTCRYQLEGGTEQMEKGTVTLVR